MGKRPVSVTLDADNILWLQARTAAGGFRSISEALNRMVTDARTSGRFGQTARSVVGTIDIAGADPDLLEADAVIRAEFETSLRRRAAAPKTTSRGRR